MINRQVRLRRHPQGLPKPRDFEIAEAPTPSLGEGEVLVRNRLVSLDPYMRGQMDAGPSYIQNVPLGGVMMAHTVGEVVESRSADYAAGDPVWCVGNWQEYSVQRAAPPLRKLDPRIDPAAWLGPLGLPGWTAHVGLLKLAEPKPGETVVVSAAAGAVGGLVGQLAKARGLRAVGIAGGPEKCAYAVEACGFDVCLDHRAPDFAEALAAATPDGIDIDFENVGGDVLEAIWPRLNPHARVVVSGLIAQYSLTSPRQGPDLTRLLKQRIRIEGFIISDYAAEFPAIIGELAGVLTGGGFNWRPDVTRGLENAPEAFIGMLEGRNRGKTLIEVGG